MKNENTIKTILEAIEKSVDKDIQAQAPKARLQENAIMDIINWLAQSWNDASPVLDQFGEDTGVTKGENFRIIVGTILGVTGTAALALGWDKIKNALMKAPGKVKQLFGAAKELKAAKSADQQDRVMAKYGANKNSVHEARAYALKQLFEATKAGGAKQDNEITGKKPADKTSGEKAEDWKEVDADTEKPFGSKPSEKKPQDASKGNFKKVTDGSSKAKKIDTDPTFSKVKGGDVKKK